MTLEQKIKLRDEIVRFAKLQHHKDYILRKRGPEYFDCAGLVYYVYKEIMGIDVFEGGYGLSYTTKIMTSPNGILTLIDENEPNKNIDLLKKGDILLIHRQDLKEIKPKEDNRYPGHCGIYIGNGKFIHATKATYNVCISHIDQDNKWKKKLIGYKRIIK